MKSIGEDAAIRALGDGTQEAGIKLLKGDLGRPRNKWCSRYNPVIVTGLSVYNLFN
jgi:hypothetical protein